MHMENHLRKWRMILGGDQNDGTGYSLKDADLQIDKTLQALYDNERTGGLGPSSPNVSRWLGDIRTYFPNTVVKVMQQDALKRLNLTSMLLEKEMLENVKPDVHLERAKGAVRWRVEGETVIEAEREQTC